MRRGIGVAPVDGLPLQQTGQPSVAGGGDFQPTGDEGGGRGAARAMSCTVTVSDKASCAQAARLVSRATGPGWAAASADKS